MKWLASASGFMGDGEEPVGRFLRRCGRLSVGWLLRRPCSGDAARGYAWSPRSRRIDGRRVLLLSADRIRELEARLVAHGIVLKTIARLLSESALAELRAAAQSIDDAGMQESNPDLHLRRVAEEMWSILEMVG